MNKLTKIFTILALTGIVSCSQVQNTVPISSNPIPTANPVMFNTCGAVSTAINEHAITLLLTATMMSLYKTGISGDGFNNKLRSAYEDWASTQTALADNIISINDGANKINTDQYNKLKMQSSAQAKHIIMLYNVVAPHGKEFKGKLVDSHTPNVSCTLKITDTNIKNAVEAPAWNTL